MIEVLVLKWATLNERRCAPGERQWTLPSDHIAKMRDLGQIEVNPRSIPAHLVQNAAFQQFFMNEIIAKVRDTSHEEDP
jgi:hypothetical protein